jgi:hypothetical protein
MITTLAELEAALLLGGDVVCDPTVTIDVTGAALTVAVPTRLLGGSLTCTSGPALLVTSSNVEVSGLTIVGGNNGVFDDTQRLIYALGTDTEPLSCVDIHDCTLTNSAAHNVWLEWCEMSRVHHNSITLGLYSGIMVISGNSIGITDNDVADIVIAAGQANCYGIAVTDALNTAAARSQRVSVVGNRVSLVDWEGIDTHGGLNIAVTGNIITACHRSIALVVGNATRVTAPVGCGVMGNIIDATGARVAADIGIFLAGQSGTPASATVVGNHINGLDGTGQQPISTTDWDRTNTYVGGNSRPHVPWSNVTLTGGWTANASFPAQYMVDGNTVSFRGGAIPPSGGTPGTPVEGTLSNPAAWPSRRTFFSITKGSNAAGGVGVLNVDVNGTIRDDYGSTFDTFTDWETGSYQAA